MFKTPILLLVFNRPEHTRRVLTQIGKIKPAFLYVVADGPRERNEQDVMNCSLTREVVTSTIDWPCQVKTLFRDKNLGCGLSPADGITWFFQQVEEGIILEDDCLPSISFFEYCQSMLAFFKEDERIMHISGNNFQNGISRGQGSYYFSAYTHNWGWATWRNRWAVFDFEMKDYSTDLVTSLSQSYGFKPDEILFWENCFQDVVNHNRNDIWDFRWMYSVWKNKGISVLPQINLVMNIGFGPQATHTHTGGDNIRGTGELHSIIHPMKRLITNHAADRYSFENHFNSKQFIITHMLNFIRSRISKIVNTIIFPIKSQFLFHRFRDFTMIPKTNYLSNLKLICKFKNVGGDVVECGTWKGGMIAGMVGVLGSGRVYHLFDSFEGLPEVKEIDGPEAKAWQSNKEGVYYFDNCKADERDAKKAMMLSGAKSFTLNKGWFNESLKGFSAPNGIAVLRLDADWYDSTMDCLIHLFPKLNKGGILILDDYYTWEGCSKAIHDYLSVNKLAYRIHSYNGICYLIKQ